MNRIQKNCRQLIKKMRDRRAFTLLEMLVVLVIVAILMAIIIPNVSGQKDRIEKQATENITEIVQTQVDAYYLVEPAGSTASLETLVSEGYLTQKQAEEAEDRIDQAELTAILTGS